MGAKEISEILASDAGTFAFVVLILISGWKGIWVWGWSYKELKRERNEWRRLALMNKDLAHDAVRVVEKQTPSFGERV